MTTDATDLVPLEGSQLTEHPALAYVAGLAPGSRRTMAEALNLIARHLSKGHSGAAAYNWAGLRYAQVKEVRSWLAATYKPAMANKCMAALRGTLKEAFVLGKLPHEEYARCMLVKGVSGDSEDTGRALTTLEMRALFDKCAEDETPAGARDAAILGVLFGAGLRRAELVKLTLADYNRADGSLTVKNGKGNRNRTLWLPEGTKAALETWLKFRGEAPGPLFQAIKKGGRIVPETMNGTGQAVLDVCRKRARQAKVEPFSPHDLRRTFISTLLDATGDVSRVQKMAGHKNVATTVRYDRRGDEADRRAAALLNVPFGSPKRGKSK
jgi:integrase/recombinase XerD